MNARRILYVVLATAGVYALWEIVSHAYLMSMPMMAWHWISGSVGVALTLIIAGVATHAILAQERKIEDLSRLKDELTKLMVHDLRAPIIATIGAMEVLKSDLGKTAPPRTREMVDMALESNRSLVGMINDLQDISKVEDGERIVDIRDADIHTLVQDAVHVVEPLAAMRAISFFTDIDPEIPILMLDGAKVKRVITNLLTNAFRFTHSEGHVDLHVNWDKDHKRVIIAVSDTGEGVPAELQRRIFDKFYRVRARHGDRVESAGLGLTFCKMIAEQHGGSIAVESMPGVGSTFTVNIPAIEAPIADRAFRL